MKTLKMSSAVIIIKNDPDEIYFILLYREGKREWQIDVEIIYWLPL